MTTTTAQTGSFPSPYEIATPEGCEGWEEMYPYYALFDERRRESDENRFWFWNSMHFPIPHPAFDVICIDSPYQAVGSWQNRVFAVPPAMGIDYRVVNGYVYISGNPVTDPDKIAERAGYFQKRAGTTSRTGPSCTASGRTRCARSSPSSTRSRSPTCPSTSPTRSPSTPSRNTAFYEVLDAYGRCLRLGDLMWQNHFEFLLLGYGAYATFAELCKNNLPDIPDQHIAQMVAGIDVLLFRPDAELRRLAGVAIDKGVDGVVRRGPDARRRSRPSCRGSDAGRDVAGRAREGQGPVVQHGHRRRAHPLLPQLAGRCEHPVRVDHRPHQRPARRRAGGAAHGRDRARARPADRGVRRAAARRDPRPVERPAQPVAHGVPLRRGAQVLLRLLVPHPLVEQGARVRRAAGRRRLLRGRRGHLPARPPRGVGGARRARPLLGHRRAAARPQALAADRGAAPGAARAPGPVDAAAGARRRTRRDHRSDDDHAVGRDHRARARVGPPDGGRHGAQRRAGVAGHDRGAGARRALGRPRSPTSATARSSSAAARRRPGPRSSPRSGAPSPTWAASCPTPRSCAASTASRRWSAPGARPRSSAPARRSGSTARRAW